MLRRISLLKYWDTLATAIVGFAITYLFTHHSGIGVSPDSIAYVSAARNWVHQGRLADYTGHPLVDFPAGFPLILAGILGLTHVDPFAFMPLVCPLMFAFLIATCGYMADRMGYPSLWYKTLLLICIALSPALIEVYIMLWSETLFIVMSVLFMVTLRRYLYLHNIWVLLLVGVICAVSCTIRYAGITMIGAGGLLLLFEKYPSFKIKLQHLFLFGVVSVSLLVINLLRNEYVSGTLTGRRQKGETPLLRNIYFYGNTFNDWFFFGSAHYRLCLILGLALLTLLSLLFTRSLSGPWFKQIPALFRGYPAFVRIALTFALLYSAFMVISATFSRYEPIDSRLLSPLFIPMVFSLAYPLSLFTRRAGEKGKRWWKLVGIVFFGLVLSSQLMADYQWYSDIEDAGIGGYTEDIWKDSPLVQFLQSKPSPLIPRYTLYSNSPEGVYFFCNRHCQLLPQQAFEGPIRQFYAEGHQYVIWFNDGDNDAILTQEQVLSHKRMILVKHFTDGAVYMTEDGGKQEK